MWPQQRQVKPFQRLQRYWLRPGSNVRTAPLSEHAVGALEQRYGFALPPDFREYLLRCCPSDDNNLDREGACWWTLDRIRSVPEEYEYQIKNDRVARAASQYLFFADYLIWCWAWAIACGNDEDRGKVVVINGISDRFVADSFGQFVDRYIVDKLSVA